MTDLTLDREILQYQGGLEAKSLLNILKTVGDSKDDTDEPTLIRYSPYYDFDMLTSTLKHKKNAFSILSINIQSIKAKFSELKIFVETLQEVGFSFSAICVQENWLSENEDTSQLQLKGYECIPQGKSCSSEGGLIIYLDEMFDTKKLMQYKTWEGQLI